ncbi:S-layer homology domain-containing protein [Paenibacillus sp. CMAA1364]
MTDTNGFKNAQATAGGIDTINAVKFGEDADGLLLSGVLSLGTLPDYTVADSVSAYVPSGPGYGVQDLILGTTYTTDTETVGTIKPTSPADTGDAIPVHVSKSVSDMYSLSANYQNGFKASNIIYNPEEIIPGFDLPVQFNVVNQGMSKIQSIDIELDGQKTNYDKLAQLPNETKAYIATYTVPASIQNIPYDVTVHFADGSQLSISGMVTLDIPDVGISEVLVMKEEDGQRRLSIPIYNKSESVLAGKGRIVKFGLYKDGVFDADHLIGQVWDISDNASLQLMDQGGYTNTVDFDVKSYLQTLNKEEIPPAGLNVFVHAWVVDAQGKEIKEFDSSNNSVKVTVTMQNTNILAVASNQDATVTLTDMSGKTLSTGAGFISFRQALERSQAGTFHRFKITVKPARQTGKTMTYTLDVTNIQTNRPELALQTKGSKQDEKKYTGDVEVALTAYQVDGFDLVQALFKVNDEDWETVPYNGTSEKRLATLSDAGIYKVSAKVKLKIGEEYALDPISVEIKKKTTTNPDPDDSSDPSEPSIPDLIAQSLLFNLQMIDWNATLKKLESRWNENASIRNKYSDMIKHWVKETIHTWVRLDVISEYPDNTFRPNRSITRAEFVTLLTRLFVFQDTNQRATAFKDVTNHWAAEAIETLAKHGVVKGLSR